jgi:hypothetical protein
MVKAQPPERKERWYTIRLFRMNSRKEGTMWHISCMQEWFSHRNSCFWAMQQWINRVVQPAYRQWLGRQTFVQVQWHHIPTVLSYHVNSVFCVVCTTQR